MNNRLLLISLLLIGLSVITLLCYYMAYAG